MKVVSGGQTGVDRAALDVALALRMEIGGWCPRERWAEDGRIPDRYALIETRSPDVHVRTQRNVESSSATLVLSRGSPMGGTRYTVEIAESMRRPILVVDITDRNRDPVAEIVGWIEQVKPQILNVAGPRESGAPGITEEVFHILKDAFVKARVCPPPMPRPISAASLPALPSRSSTPPVKSDPNAKRCAAN
jgi:putative molybdenum carrier protein